MKIKFKFNYFYNCWKVFTIFLFGLIAYELVCLSKEVLTETQKEKFKDAELEISLCYWSNLNNETCYHIKDHQFANPNSKKYPKYNFTCEFEELIGCYTKNFNNLSPKKIIEKLKKCNISNLATVESETNSISRIDPTYELYNIYICVNYRFKIKNNSFTKLNFKVTNNQMNQPFNLFLTFSNRLENEIYRTKKTQIFRRSCWSAKDKIDCTETNKRINFNFVLFSSKNLESPFASNCVYRKNSSQNDCYENCIKKNRKYHLLTYKETDNFTLNFESSSNFEELISKCENECEKEDCLNMGFFTRDVFSEDIKNQVKGSININLINVYYLMKAVPLYKKSEIVWMFLVSFFTLFGINFSNKMLKKIRIYNFKVFRGKNKKNNKKNFIISTTIAIVVLSLSLILEKVVFDFGKKNHSTLSQENFITERNVSISICFDLCEIIKSEFKNNYINCNDELLLKKSINELNQITWDVQDFKINAAMRNTVRRYPIRQNDFSIPYFYRNFKKCFLLFYLSNNYWPHLSITKTSKIHINITNASYSFFIEDGYNLPKMNSISAEKSYLHRVDTAERKLRDGCKNYYKDDYIQDCLIEKSKKKDNVIPIKVNFRIDKNNSEYLKLKFLDNSNFDNYLKECNDQFPEAECISTSTSLVYKRIDNNIDNITVTLTPYAYNFKQLDDENGLVVLNRILSYQIILTGFSIKEFLNLLISIYFISFRSIYNYQLFKRIFNLILFLIYLIQFLFLFHNIIYHQMISSIFFENLNSTIIPKIRICYQIKENLDFDNSLTLKYLEETTIKLEDALEEILIYDNDNYIGAKFTVENFTIESKDLWRAKNSKHYINIFYIKNLKCFNIQMRTMIKNGNMGIQYHKLYKLILINIKKFKEYKVFIFLNSEKDLDLLWENESSYMDYTYNYIPRERYYNDDYFYLKNMYRNFKKLFGLSKILNDLFLYLDYLKDSYFKEQYAKTTMTILRSNDKEDNTLIKNRQFNFYIQFRSIATDKNDNYDFTVNNRITYFIYSYYVEKNIPNSKNLKIAINSSIIKTKMFTVNKYRVVELFLHLLILTSFYFKFDFISLPVFVKQSYPFIKFFFIYFLYYIVSFIVLLFEIWFKLVKFMKFKND